MERSLFEALLERNFDDLPAEVRCVHDARSLKQLKGRCDIERGGHWLVAPIAAVALLPNSKRDAGVQVDIQSVGMSESWRRNFEGHAMHSELWKADRCLAERLGPMTFHFMLTVEERRIEWRVAKAHFLGIPLPAKWFAETRATEFLDNGRYAFDVRATLPWIGLLIRYRGWLAE